MNSITLNIAKKRLNYQKPVYYTTKLGNKLRVKKIVKHHDGTITVIAINNYMTTVKPEFLGTFSIN